VNTTLKLPLCVLFITLLFATNTLSANEKVKEILLGHDWHCKWVDEKYSWNSVRIYKKATLKKVTAKIRNDVCPDDYAKFRGSIKNGKLYGRFSNYPKPCGSGDIVSLSTLYKSVDGNYYTKEIYKYGFSIEVWDRAADYWIKDTHGETICTATPK